MLYRFDRAARLLDRLERVLAEDAEVLEKEIELALAQAPTALFGGQADGSPILVVRKSAPGQKMADIIALDSAGRLVLVECKRGWATRAALAQLLDYASDYAKDGAQRLERDWSLGEGRAGGSVLEAFRAFADDPAFPADMLAREQVLVVVAAGRDDGFLKIAEFLRSRGVEVHFAQVGLYARSNGELYLEVDPIQVGRNTDDPNPPHAQAWLINTDETHSPGAWRRFLDRGVAAIWGYENGPATLQQGARAGDPIYAYQNGRGVIAAGIVVDGEVHQAPREESVFPECKDGNEWHLKVSWSATPESTKSLSNAEVRAAAGAGLPVRNTFCRLWDAGVRRTLAQHFGSRVMR